MPLRLPIPETERPHVGRFALTFGGMVVAWACLHDAYLIHVEPRHFTLYHQPLLPLQNLWLLAVQYAVVATLGPGLAFGFLAWAACRTGARKRVSLQRAATGFAIVMVCVELMLLGVGLVARARLANGAPPLYPAWIYPDVTPGIIVSQTINVSAYLGAPIIGALYLVLLRLKRKPPSRARPQA